MTSATGSKPLLWHRKPTVGCTRTSERTELVLVDRVRVEQRGTGPGLVGKEGLRTREDLPPSQAPVRDTSTRRLYLEPCTLAHRHSQVCMSASDTRRRMKVTDPIRNRSRDWARVPEGSGRDRGRRRPSRGRSPRRSVTEYTGQVPHRSCRNLTEGWGGVFVGGFFQRNIKRGGGTGGSDVHSPAHS